MSLTPLEKIFSLVNVFPDKKQLTIFGIHFVWKRKNKFENLPIQKNKVVFWSSTNSFACNPKYIALKLAEAVGELELVWISLKKLNYAPELGGRIRFVSGLEASLKELATAHVVVSNERTLDWMCKHFLKKAGQYFINTWHGALGIKKTGQDRGDLTEGEIERAEIDSRNVDLIVSNGKYTSSLYRRIFFGHGTVVETGLPRNDIFFHPHDNKVHRYLNISNSTRLVLYAPTVRENGSVDWCDLEPQPIVDALEKRFGGKWLFLSRMHHLIIDKIPVKGIDVSSYPDIQEIMAESDIVITDYSSCIYDFVLTKKPGFIYAKDRQEYEGGRGLYYPLLETPFPIAETEDQLINAILSFDDNQYQQKVEEFLVGKGCCEDGCASDRVARFILNVMKDSEIDFSQIGMADRYFD